jgi:hypothetical protein
MNTKIKFLTDEEGKRHSVVIPVEDYQEMLEDIEDLVTIAERKSETNITIEELKKNLKIDELI